VNVITGKTGLLEAMIEAYQMEKGLYDFYRRSASRAEDRAVQEAFDKLSAWENEHMRYIQFLYQAIRDERETSTFQEFQKSTPADEIEGGIPVREAKATWAKRDFKTDRDALNLALDIETQARDFYQKLVDSVDDTNLRVFLGDMVRQEERHIGVIQRLLEQSSG
jgi:rubrerythrin